jgi:hypothetical protein
MSRGGLAGLRFRRRGYSGGKGGNEKMNRQDLKDLEGAQAHDFNASDGDFIEVFEVFVVRF